MCTYIIEKAAVFGSAKGARGWMKIDTANVYFDHPFHAPLDHSLNIDFVSEADGANERVAVELSAESAGERRGSARGLGFRRQSRAPRGPRSGPCVSIVNEI